MLSCHIHPDLCDFFPSDFRTKILYVFLMSSLRALCPGYLKHLKLSFPSDICISLVSSLANRLWCCIEFSFIQHMTPLQLNP